ncbi:hypothetical protein [Arsenicibacter rosenii]|nr:hypothetical protein [Arsenicibacter rosenii]
MLLVLLLLMLFCPKLLDRLMVNRLQQMIYAKRAKQNDASVQKPN